MAGIRFVDAPAGLRIEHPRHPPITVGVEGWRFVLASDGGELGRFGIVDVEGVARRVCELLRQGGGPRARRALLPPRETVPHPWLVVGRLLERRDALLAVADPRLRAVSAAVAAIVEPPPALVCAEALYADPWIARDVLAYPAAAIALAYVETTLRPPGLVWEPATPAGEAALLDAMRSWRGLFSPTGATYRSLDRTLMQLPAGFPPALLCGLRRLRLPRALTHPVELAFVLVAHDVYAAADPRAAESHLAVVLGARADEIVEAVRHVGCYVDRRLSPRRAADLRTVLQVLRDDPRPWRGRLPGLVERALRWHEIEPAVRDEVEALGGEAARTARPPLPLPEIEGITFLDTVAAIVAEGERMHHCIATYARRAVAGQSYLFHVQHRGAAASVEVDRSGRVVQANGPCNTENVATRWGTRRLAAWAAPLLPEPVRRRRTARAVLRRTRRVAVPDPAVQLELWPG